jgi:hypothetical protein
LIPLERDKSNGDEGLAEEFMRRQGFGLDEIDAWFRRPSNR